MIKQPQLIIYTRNRDVDYRMVITPDESLCPADTRKYFRKLIRGAIDVETYDDPLNEPRWLIARKDNVILYGVAIMLEIFGTDCCTDFTGRNVRGFFGIVVDASDDDVKLPFGIEFFRAVNNKYIEPLWDSTKEEFIRKSIEADIEEYDGETISGVDKTIFMNVSTEQCLILGKVDLKSALESALACKCDISMVTGFNSKHHAFADEADYDFMNAIVNSVNEPETHKKEFQAPTTKSGCVVVPPPIPQSQKKVLRPKMIMMLIVIAAILVVLMLIKTCTTTPTSQNSSTSGDQNRISVNDSIQKN